MKENKILIIDEVHPVFLERLEKNGICYDYFPDMDNNDVIDNIHSYEGVVLRSKILADRAFIDKGEKLKFIGRVGAGMETIDVDYAESKGIRCLNSPEGNRDAVGEHVIGMLLVLMNNLFKSNIEVKHKIWDREGNRGEEIKGKTVGIIGYGNMGSALAEKLSSFGATVIAFDKYKTNFSSSYVKEVQLSEIFNTADIVSLHVPQTTETINMVDDDFISSFKKPFYLINTARGKVANTEAIVNGLKCGKIKGAGLDVLEYENYNFENFLKDIMPEAFNYLVSSPQVVLSPHVGGWTVESKMKLSQFLADKIIDIYKLT